MTSLALGVDLGGTNMRVALFDDVGGQRTLLREHREPTGEARDPESIVRRLGAAVDTMLTNADGDVPVGIGIAGMLRGSEGHVANAPHLHWRNVPFGTMMRERLTGRNVVIANDVNAITWGEFVVGAGRGVNDVLAVFLGTGLGAGIISSGALVEGATGCAAELGHLKVVFDETARACNCGMHGCVEAYVGGAYLVERVAAEIAAGATTSASAHASGGPIYPQHVDRAASDGDAYAVALWDEVALLLGLALANSVTALNPARLILGGGVLSKSPHLRQRAIDAIRAFANPPALEELTVVDAALGDDAGLIGAALLATR